MKRTMTCSCGYVVRARSDEELYMLVRRHIIPMDREKHHPLREQQDVDGARRGLRRITRRRVHA